ncbi:GAF domain-containing sensor histidine kinase [Luteolibacter pohnpeiensis]|uniref:histidine kinase n=1 Tax=Luteolibacter pohnpeiensis TaxID=454153 RepID=A0A934SB36_9BACT|nr:GAF domain-containing sensor histidine kinase [Luteolibacter pohnpeiensis]MBK1882063.1 GAF domain-containing sensor histidine kinase [Luteolibacter pohnpeiensis]
MLSFYPLVDDAFRTHGLHFRGLSNSIPRLHLYQIHARNFAVPESFDPDTQINPLEDPRRLKLISRLTATETPRDKEFDRITRIGANILKTPICLVSLVTSDQQIFKGACGLPEHLIKERSTPLSYSICKHAVLSRNPIIITDTHQSELVADNLAVSDLGIRSYLGFPLLTDDYLVLGSFCVIDYVPRDWTTDEIDLTRDLAALVVEQLESSLVREKIRNSFDVAIHDLKSPLGGIMMASSLLEEDLKSIPERLHPLLAVISESVGKSLKLVESLAKDNRDGTPQYCEYPDQVIHSVASRLRPTADAKSISLQVNMDDATSLSVSPWVLEQVMENLTSNSIKFGPPESNVHIWFTPSERIGHIHIRDEGPGFTVADRRRMFKRYSRLSASPTANETSTGLGLSIVKRLLDQHGGSIELLSPEGSGAEFRISFPISS